MQQGVADPAELTEVAVPALGPDDDEVRGRGAVQEHLAGGPFDRRPVYADARVVHHRVAEHGVEQFRCPVLVAALRFPGEPGIVGRLVRGAAPCAYDIEGALACLGLAEGEPRRLHAGGRVSRTQQNPLMGTLQSGLVAADHDRRAVCSSRHSEADRAQEQTLELAAAT